MSNKITIAHIIDRNEVRQLDDSLIEKIPLRDELREAIRDFRKLVGKDNLWYLGTDRRYRTALSPQVIYANLESGGAMLAQDRYAHNLGNCIEITPRSTKKVIPYTSITLAPGVTVIDVRTKTLYPFLTTVFATPNDLEKS